MNKIIELIEADDFNFNNCCYTFLNAPFESFDDFESTYRSTNRTSKSYDSYELFVLNDSVVLNSSSLESCYIFKFVQGEFIMEYFKDPATIMSRYAHSSFYKDEMYF